MTADLMATRSKVVSNRKSDDYTGFAGVRSGHKMGISLTQRARRPRPRGNVIEPSPCAGVESMIEF